MKVKVISSCFDRYTGELLLAGTVIDVPEERAEAGIARGLFAKHTEKKKRNTKVAKAEKQETDK